MATLKLQSVEGATFHISVEAAKGSLLLKGMLEHFGEGQPAGGNKDEDVVPIPKIRADNVQRVIKWLEYHKDGGLPDEDEEEEVVHDPRAPELNTWENKFLDVNHITLVQLTLASHFLEINNLFDACSKKIASFIIGKSPEEIRSLFNLADDLTPEEKQIIQMQNDLCVIQR